MSKAEQILKADLDCLRLASDLIQLGNEVPNHVLKAHLLRLARTCTRLVERPETRH